MEHRFHVAERLAGRIRIMVGHHAPFRLYQRNECDHSNDRGRVAISRRGHFCHGHKVFPDQAILNCSALTRENRFAGRVRGAAERTADMDISAFQHKLGIILIMKWNTLAFLWLLLSFSVSAVEQPAHWGSAVNGFPVCLSISNAVSPWDQPLLATVQVRNDSDADQWLAITPFEVLTSFIATDGNRRQVEIKPPDIESPSSPGSRAIPLSPGGV